MFIGQTSVTYLRDRLKFCILLCTLFKTHLYHLSIYVRKLYLTLFIKHNIKSCPANFLLNILIRL